VLDTTVLEKETENLAVRLRQARCCDALRPCPRCAIMRDNLLARRRLLASQRPVRRRAAAPWAMLARSRDLMLKAG
jgi:hypothetical protein